MYFNCYTIDFSVNLMNKNKLINIAFFFISLLYSISINRLNISIINNSNDSDHLLLVHGSTIVSPDDVWYNSQIKNYLNGDGFTIDPSDKVMSVRRTPGYPLFYGIHYALLGEELAHNFIPYTQSLIFALSVIALGSILRLISSSVVFGYTIMALYGTSLYPTSYLFYTITESIHPAFVIFSLYFLIKYIYDKNRLKYIILSGIFCAIATLIRPTNGILIITLFGTLLFYGSNNIRHKIKLILILILSFAFMFAPWVIHNYIKVERFIPLEDYAHNHTYGGYGEKNMALYSWWSSWGAPSGVNLHQEIMHDIFTDNPHKSIKKFVYETVPEYAYVGYSKVELFDTLAQYQKCIEEGIKLNDNNFDINTLRAKWGESPIPCEISVSDRFYNLRNKIKKGDPIRFFIIAPLLTRGSEYIFHSFTAAWHSLNPTDGNLTIVQYIVKGVSYVTNVLLWFFSFVYIFITNRHVFEKILLGSFFIISFFIFIYFRHVEVRYMLSAYPLMYIMSTISIGSIINNIMKK